MSSTLQHPDWNNSTILRGDVANQLWELKEGLDGDLVVLASFQLAEMLLEHGLVDELRLKIHPVILGAGDRLFRGTSRKKPVHLVHVQTLDDGVANLTYRLSAAA